jgi:predicted metal-dependent phosphoesterase TrpH
MTVVTSRVDLHIHTTASDGSLNPVELVAQAARLGLDVIAITDHDTTGGVPAALEAGRRHGVVVVPGVEISALAGRQELHILGYFVDIHAAGLQTTLGLTREARWERARSMAGRLSRLGLHMPWERVAEIASQSEAVGRQHIAQAMLAAGHVTTLDEAFELWIGRHAPAYVERFKLTPEQAIQSIVRSGGLAVLAHPYSFSPSGECRSSLDLQAWLPRLGRAGLSGLEVYYPNYPQRTIRRLLEIAKAHDIVPTGGSDYHGLPHHRLGSVSVPPAVWKLLQARHRRQQCRTLVGAAGG